MGYNAGLAVGLAIGLPCFFIGLLCLGLYVRRRRLQKEEDKADNYDADNNSFEEFGEALHEPYKAAENPQASVDKMSLVGDTQSHSKESCSSPDQSTERKRAFAPQHHAKKNSAYDFYDTFIPIMPADGPRDDLPQPPAITDKHSLHSNTTGSHGSVCLADNSSRSLDNLAKQLQNPQFFGMSPTRAATVGGAKPRAFAADNSSSDVLNDTAFEHGGINDSFVNERVVTQRHPYREKTESAGVKGEPTMSLERSFDNAFDPATDEELPDVQFK